MHASACNQSLGYPCILCHFFFFQKCPKHKVGAIKFQTDPNSSLLGGFNESAATSFTPSVKS